MASVFLVTSGSYSDYSVNRAFSTEESAKAWIGEATAEDEDGRGGYSIEECALDDDSDAPIAGSRCAIDAEGACDFMPLVLLNRDQLATMNLYTYAKQPWRLVVMFDHRDEARANKVCAEKRAQMIALHGSEPAEGGYDREACHLTRPAPRRGITTASLADICLFTQTVVAAETGDLPAGLARIMAEQLKDKP